MRTTWPAVTLCDVVLMQYSIMLLRHLPTSLILSVSTFMRSKTMDPHALIERAQTSLGLKPICDPEISAASMISLVTLVIRIVDHFFLWYTTHSGVWPPALCCQRCSTHRFITATTQALRWPVSLFPIYSPFTPFFWLVKIIMKKSAEVQN